MLLEKTCKKHGVTTFIRYSNGRERCRQCATDSVRKTTQKNRRILIEEAGGECKNCGYDKFPGILELHHRDPTTKVRGIIGSGSYGLAKQRIEAAKCDLLCPNCHAEQHYKPN